MSPPPLLSFRWWMNTVEPPSAMWVWFKCWCRISDGCARVEEVGVAVAVGVGGNHWVEVGCQGCGIRGVTTGVTRIPKVETVISIFHDYK